MKKEKIFVPRHTRAKPTAKRTERAIERKERTVGKLACKDVDD